MRFVIVINIRPFFATFSSRLKMLNEYVKVAIWGEVSDISTHSLNVCVNMH